MATRLLPDTDQIRAVRERIEQQDLTLFQRAELALELEDELARIPRADRPKPWNILIEMARIGGVSAATLAKVKVIAAEADDRVKTMLRSGELQVAVAYSQLREPAKSSHPTLTLFFAHHRQRIGQQALTPFHRAELALELEDELAKTPRASRPKPWNVRAELARIAGVSEGTLALVRRLLAQADQETLGLLRDGKLAIHLVARWLRKPPAKRPHPIAFEASLVSIRAAARLNRSNWYAIKALIDKGFLRAYPCGRTRTGEIVLKVNPDEVAPALERARAARAKR